MKAYKGIKNRKVYIDFDLFVDMSKGLNERNIQRHKALKHLDPFFNLVGKQRKYKTPAELEQYIEEYFQSCWGCVYTPEGQLIRDEKGVPIKVQKKPYTLAGLALHLGITRDTLTQYENRSKAGNIPQEYAEIVVRAKQRIEAYAEEQIYTREGSNGAKFVLGSGFRWMTPKEQADIQARKKQLKLQQKEFKLKKRLLEGNKDNEDSQLEIRIVRATKEDK